MLLSDKFWLAGLLEGEGSFMRPAPSKPNAPIIAVNMTDEDIIARVAHLFGVKYQKAKRKLKKPHWKKSFMASCKGQRAINLMNALRPLMGQRRQSQIDAALWSHNPYKTNIKLTPKDVKEIRKRCAKGENQSHIAAEYKLHRTTVCKIYRRRKWKSVK